MLKLKNINKEYSKKVVLSDVNIEINANEIIGLVGENGVGKSTIMKIIAGLIKKYSGERIISKDLKLGYLIDNPSFYNNYDTKTNLRLLSMYNPNITDEDIDKIYDLFKLSEFGKKKFLNYSLGMKQRLGIALSLLGSPDLLILDEPFNGVDPKMSILIMDILKNWVKITNGSILISSHILSQLDTLCNRVLFVSNGHITNEQTLKDLNSNTLIYVIKLLNKDESLYNYLKNNNIEILEQKDFSEFKIRIDTDSKDIISYIRKNFSIDELYKEKESLETIFRKIEGI
ncbi:ABC-2 type transport system ATP-binding protein [Clostridium sp. DSM 8431]|uniref:ABC transporter ATP-binding protein n=1 Tax=Clostridium sp. DSM 8431 TaxID=1761781 RepID=UPI0008E0A743|nr:ABC transporter ATP-binding protein [Clostridium sp. DSM 8431]SFU68893.1 ABC-2 type transport system ATP-binding protein [Clostridium sp. DSM 8431]